METTSIDFMPLIAPLLTVLSTLLVGFLTAAAHKLQVKLGLEADEKSIQRVREAIQNGVNYASDKIARMAEGKLSVSVKNDIARKAARYAITQVPAVVKKMNFDFDHLENWAFSILAGENQTAEYHKATDPMPAKEETGG